MSNEKLEQLELKAAELQTEIHKIKTELQKSKRRDEDCRLTQQLISEGLLPDGWCIHKVVVGNRTFFMICDVPNFHDCVDNITLRFYTPDCFSERHRDQYIRNVLQSIQILRGSSPKKKRPIR